MKQFLLALTLMLGLAIGHAAADYIVIVADVSQSRDAPRPTGNNQGGGGNIGAPGGGAIGRPGGGNIGAPGGGNIGRPGGGALGAPGGGALGAPGGGALGAPGGGALGAPGGGALGAPGGGALGAPGGGALGAPGGGNFGVGGGGAFGAPGGGNPGSVSPPAPRIRVMAVVEVKNQLQPKVIPITPNDSRSAAFVKHKWGESPVWDMPGVTINIVKQADGKPLPAVSKRFEDESKKVRKDGAPSPDRLLTLANWALEHGMIKEFETTMDELAEKDKANAVVVAYLKVRDGVRGSLPAGEAASKWTQRLFSSYRTAPSNHYNLLHNALSDDVPEVKSRLGHLEDTFAGFYYWHALKGKVLAMPKQKLTAVLMSDKDVASAFARQNRTFDSTAVIADSFFTPRHNLAVYSSNRLDQPYASLVKSTSGFWKVVDRDKILQPKPEVPKKIPFNEVWDAQTLALLIKAADAEGEIASTSHTGTRQLLIASGLLPGSVIFPRWIESGTGSVFQTPAGSPWRSFGAPHFIHLLKFRELKDQGKLGDSAVAALRRVVTDGFFHEAKVRDGSPEARATAWALAYFLAQKKTDALHAYFTELSKTPRDLDLDDDALLDGFARATGCMDEKDQRSEAKLTALAEEWFSYIGNEATLEPGALPLFELVYKLEKELEEERTMTPRPRPGGGNPGGGNPGGGIVPGGPGGGPVRPGGY